jgi:tellurite resistance protein TehA-like permease
VLGSQCLTVVTLPLVARALALFGALCWIVLTYLFLAATITARIKPRFTRSINGGWLVAIVATQALAVLLVLLVAQTPGAGATWLFVALCLYLLGDALYLLIITLVVYRIVFFPLRAREFTPPYWINMGALAITTLAGSLLVLHTPACSALAELMPFVKGFTLFFWATATWWIPLLVILEVWRYGWRRVPLRYEVDAWDIVFPLGMYTVGTFALAQALHLDFLLAIPAVGVFVSSLMWLIVGIGAAAHLFRRGRADRAAGHLQSSR